MPPLYNNQCCLRQQALFIPALPRRGIQVLSLVKEALFHYAQENGYSVIVGEEMEAVIDLKNVLALPVKSAPEREELDEAVRQLGL